MCIQDLKMGRHKYTRLVQQTVSADGLQHPGSQTTVVVPQPSWTLPRIFLGANANRTALRLVLAYPGRINSETNLFEDRNTYVIGFPYTGEYNPTGTINQDIYAALSVHNRANMSDQITLEEFGTLLLGPWVFVPMWNQDNDIFFGGYTVWDIQGDNTLMNVAQQPPEV